MAMYGEPHVAAECTCTEREFGRCARPTVRPGRNVHDDRDHGDGSDTRARGRRTSGSLTETRVRDWQDWPDRFDGSAGRHMTPCPLDGTDPLARPVHAVRTASTRGTTRATALVHGATRQGWSKGSDDAVIHETSFVVQRVRNPSGEGSARPHR